MLATVHITWNGYGLFEPIQQLDKRRILQELRSTGIAQKSMFFIHQYPRPPGDNAFMFTVNLYADGWVGERMDCARGDSDDCVLPKMEATSIQWVHNWVSVLV